MALQSFTAYYSGVTFAANKVMAGILNGHATEILKVWRVGLLNSQTSAVTGVVCQPEFSIYQTGGVSLTGGTAVTPTPHDSTNTAPTTATYSYNSTPAGTRTPVRRIFWSSDEASISAATMDELETFVPMNIIWDAGYGETNVQPLTLRQTEMATVYNTTGAAGLLDTWIEFTKE